MAAQMQPSNQPEHEHKQDREESQWGKVREDLAKQIKPLLDKHEAENPKKLSDAKLLCIENRYLHRAAFYRLPEVVQGILDIYKEHLTTKDFQAALDQCKERSVWGKNTYWWYEYSPLHFAVHNLYEGNPLPEGSEQVVEILLKAGAYVNPLDENKRTPLHHAARNASSTLIELILKYTPEKDKKSVLENLDDCGMTPLMSLLTRGITWNNEERCLAALDTLIKAGANVNNPNKETYMPPRHSMDMNLARRKTPWTVYPLHYAAMHGNTPKYLEKLIAAGAALWNVESENRENAFDFALNERQLENVKTLICFGLSGKHGSYERFKLHYPELHTLMIVVGMYNVFPYRKKSDSYAAIKKAYLEKTKDEGFFNAAQSPEFLEIVAKELNFLQQIPLVNNAITTLLTQDIEDNVKQVATLIANGKGKEALELQLKLHSDILQRKDNIKNILSYTITLQTLCAISPKLILSASCIIKLQTLIKELLTTEPSLKAEKAVKPDNLGLSPSSNIGLSNVELSDEAIIASSGDARPLEASKKETQEALDMNVVFTLSPQAKAAATAGLLPKQENSASALATDSVPATDAQTPATKKK